LKYKLEWHNPETQVSLGVFVHESYDLTQRPGCPICGKAAEFNQGQTGETEQGNAIYSEWWECHKCGIESEPYEVSQRGI